MVIKIAATRHMKPRAMIWGVTGQDGSYLAEFLLQKGYEVFGVTRRSSVNTTERLTDLFSDSDLNKNFTLVEGDITDASSVSVLMNYHQVDECYNLAAQSHVQTSFDQPSYTFNVNAGGVLNILEAIRNHSPTTKFYQASTSEMFGNNFTEKDGKKYQDENTTLAPTSPYAVAKTAAHYLVNNYRKAYDVYGACGILFNHESERRGEKFVTRKITKWIGEFDCWLKKHGMYDDMDGCVNQKMMQKNNSDYVHGISNHDEEVSFPKLRLGNIDTYRDWGHAKDYCEAMWLMLQQGKPEDYVIASGQTHSIKDFLYQAFKQIGLSSNYEDFIIIDPKFYRPSDVLYLCGCSDKAEVDLGWRPKTSFNQLVKLMVKSDIEKANK